MSAQQKAAQMQPGSTVRWDDLERAAFEQHAAVLDPRARVIPRRENKASFVLTAIVGIPLVLIYFACYLAPVWGYAAVYDGVIASAAPKPVPETAIPLAGIFYYIEFGFLLLSTMHWLVTGLKRNALYQVQAGLALALGSITALRVTVLGRGSDVEGWQSWTIPMIASIALGALFLLLHLIVTLRRAVRAEAGAKDSAEQALSKADRALLERRRKRVAALSETQRAAIRRDLSSSLAELESRGLISAEEARSAGAIELGALAILGPSNAPPE